MSAALDSSPLTCGRAAVRGEAAEGLLVAGGGGLWAASTSYGMRDGDMGRESALSSCGRRGARVYAAASALGGGEGPLRGVVRHGASGSGEADLVSRRLGRERQYPA